MFTNYIYVGALCYATHSYAPHACGAPSKRCYARAPYAIERMNRSSEQLYSAHQSAPLARAWLSLPNVLRVILFSPASSGSRIHVYCTEVCRFSPPRRLFLSPLFRPPLPSVSARLSSLPRLRLVSASALLCSFLLCSALFCSVLLQPLPRLGYRFRLTLLSCDSNTYKDYINMMLSP